MAVKEVNPLQQQNPEELLPQGRQHLPQIKALSAPVCCREQALKLQTSLLQGLLGSEAVHHFPCSHHIADVDSREQRLHNVKGSKAAQQLRVLRSRSLVH